MKSRKKIIDEATDFIMWELVLDDNGDHFNIGVQKDGEYQLIGCLWFEDSAFNKQQANQISSKLCLLYNKLSESSTKTIDSFFNGVLPSKSKSLNKYGQSICCRLPQKTVNEVEKFSRENGMNRSDGLRMLIRAGLTYVGEVNNYE